MLAKIEHSYEDELLVEVPQNTRPKNSYKLRALYFLACMRPKTLNNVLLDLLQGCHDANMVLHPSDQLTYLTAYDKDNVDHQRLIEAIYEILCQINDNIHDGDVSLSEALKEMSLVGALMLDQANEEEYRPYEEIEFDRVLAIASVAMDKGPYETQNLQQFSDEDMEKEWFESAEYLYAVENDRLYKDSMDFEQGKDPLDDLDDEHSVWMKPVHEILTKKEEDAANESEATHLEEVHVEQSMWMKFKSKFMGIKQGDPKDLEGALIDEDYQDILLQDDHAISELTVHMDDVRVKDDKVDSKAKSKWFGNMDMREDKSALGYYGNVKLLGLFALKEGIFVETREDIRIIENNIHPLLKEFSNINWVTRDGTRVAYY
jgi:hypothetical protein